MCFQRVRHPRTEKTHLICSGGWRQKRTTKGTLMLWGKAISRKNRRRTKLLKQRTNSPPQKQAKESNKLFYYGDHAKATAKNDRNWRNPTREKQTNETVVKLYSFVKTKILELWGCLAFHSAVHLQERELKSANKVKKSKIVKKCSAPGTRVNHWRKADHMVVCTNW